MIKTNKNPNWWIWERPATIHLIYTASLGAEHELKKSLGYCYAPFLYGIFKNGMVKFVCDFDKLIENGRRVVQGLLAGDNYTQKKKRWDELTQEMLWWNEKFKELELDSLTDKELLTLYSSYDSMYLKWWGFTQVAELVSYGGEELLKKGLKQITISPERNFSPEQFNHYFNTLVTPTKKSFTNFEEENIFKIVQLAYLKGISSPEVKESIREHSKKYFWLQNNYYDTIQLDEKHFQKIVQKHLQEKADVNQLIKSNEKRLHQALKEKEKLASQLKLKGDMVKLVEILDDFCYLQDERKAVNMQCDAVVDSFCKEVARRKDISYTLLRWAIPLQIKELLKGNKILPLQFKKQGEHSLIIFNENNNNPEILLGRDADIREQEILGAEKELKQILEIEGGCASTGRAQGKVRILLSPREVGKMQKGDILVTTMTSPEFLPAIKKASAIVTDEGGITCHAAIISRELGIPCVIGTKIATKVLKDGLIVEIRANHGLVKIIP